MSTRTRISVQAAAWISRLNADDRTAAVDAACQEWLAADPQHQAAFQIANRMWDDAAALPVSLAARIGTGRREWPLADDRWLGLPVRPSSFAVKGWAIAAGVAVAVFAGVLFHLQRPQVLQTETGQQLTLALDDGSHLTLNTDTRVRVRFDKQARRIDLESGEALFDVAEDPVRPFVVRAGDREIRALGTQFVVRHDPIQTSVTLVDGKVSVSGESSSVSGTRHLPPSAEKRDSRARGEGLTRVTVLEPGERVTFDPRTRLAVLDRPAIEAVTAWRKGEIVFENTPLSRAVEEMNRYSTRKLRLASGAAAQLPVSGLFRSGDAENFALALTNTHPLEAVEQGSEIEIRAR